MKLSQVKYMLLFPLMWPLYSSAQVRTEQLLEKGWKFTRQDEKTFCNPDLDDRKWQSVTVPHDWAIYGPFSINNDKQMTAIAQDGQKEAMEHAGRTGGLPLWVLAGIVWILKFRNMPKGKTVFYFLTER